MAKRSPNANASICMRWRSANDQVGLCRVEQRVIFASVLSCEVAFFVVTVVTFGVAIIVAIVVVIVVVV